MRAISHSKWNLCFKLYNQELDIHINIKQRLPNALRLLVWLLSIDLAKFLAR